MMKHEGECSTVLSLRTIESEYISPRVEPLSPSNGILIHISHRNVPQKNFQNETRATMDVDYFLNCPQQQFLLDITETSIEGILDVMLEKTFEGKGLLIEEAKRKLLVHNSMSLLTDTIQGAFSQENEPYEYDQSWLCTMCTLSTIQKRQIIIARLKHPVNLGRTLQEIRFIILVVSPSKEKGTKNALETGRTFATLFSYPEFRQAMLKLRDANSCKYVVTEFAKQIAYTNSLSSTSKETRPIVSQVKRCPFARGLCEDFTRRLSYYISDYVDGVVGPKTIHKTTSTIFFLYFACILPTIAFGSLHDYNTSGKIDVRKCIIAQTIGGLLFAVFGGQPLVIIMTTAPLSIYIKVIYNISNNFGLDFIAMYACVGLWNTFFLLVYAVCDASILMKWCTRSTEEIFSLFIAIAFGIDAGKSTYNNFRTNYMSPGCKSNLSNHSFDDSSWNMTTMSSSECHRDSSLLCLLLMLGTVWLGLTVYNFNKSPYLQAKSREMLSDYSLPIAVLVLSFIGSFVFQDVSIERFNYVQKQIFILAPLSTLPPLAIIGAMGLGFVLSLLFFMDQNISAAMVNNPSNKMKKGPAYHLDLVVVGIINAFLSIFGLPWMHGVLPHSPLHALRLATVEKRVDQGYAYEMVVQARETRLTGILSHILIGLSILLLPYPLAYIPTPVLDGLFLYMAVSSLNGNHMFERFLLFFIEQAAYPPNHYIRQCPQREIHKFTICQVIQLAFISLFGFYPLPYVTMIFPVAIFLLLPLRLKVLPIFIEDRYLEVLDGLHR